MDAIELDQAALRAVIDAVAMARAQSARLGLAALRAEAGGGETAREQVEAARTGVAQGLALVAGDGPMEGHAAANLRWIRAVAAGEPGLVDRFRAFDALSARLLDAVRSDGVTPALAGEVVVAGSDDFYDATTRLMVLLWTDLETRRQGSVAAAKEAIEAVQAAFAGLSDRAAQAHILALNARIEAAHAREAAFGVIAEEMGGLADAIASMAKGAGRTLEEAQDRL